MDETAILALFDQWNNAIQSKEPKNVVALYEDDGVLLPTISNKVCYNHQDREAYFTVFLDRHPVGKIDESKIRIFDDTAIHSGVYTFTFKDGGPVQARFTFIYRKHGEQWLINEHHSSQMPESTFI